MLYIEAYTDGSCKKTSSGGWGWIAYITNTQTMTNKCMHRDTKIDKSNFEDYNYTYSDWGGSLKTTNQRMELHAMADLLEFCPRGNHVSIKTYSDSMYTVGGIIGRTKDLTSLVQYKKGWLYKWINPTVKFGDKLTSKYWRATMEPKNSDLWYRIHQALLMHIQSNTLMWFGWVKGHSNHKGNDIADKLSREFYNTM